MLAVMSFQARGFCSLAFFLWLEVFSAYAVVIKMQNVGLSTCIFECASCLEVLRCKGSRLSGSCFVKLHKQLMDLRSMIMRKVSSFINE